nr:hypothetical protein [Tanacetum cinerariifolium]
EEDEDEAENQNPWAFDDEVADEDEYNEEVADEDEGRYNNCTKETKREENLKNWKWEDVIVIDDVDVPNKVAETDNNAEVKEEHVTLDVPKQLDVENDDDVPPTPINESNWAVCKTRTFALGDKPHSFFAPEGKPLRRGLNPRPFACGNNLPKVTLGGHLS